MTTSTASNSQTPHPVYLTLVGANGERCDEIHAQGDDPNALYTNGGSVLQEYYIFCLVLHKYMYIISYQNIYSAS